MPTVLLARLLSILSDLTVGRRAAPDDQLVRGLAVLVGFLGYNLSAPDRDNPSRWLTFGAQLTLAVATSLLLGLAAGWVYRAIKLLLVTLRDSRPLQPMRELQARAATYPAPEDYRPGWDGLIEIAMILPVVVVAGGVLQLVEFPGWPSHVLLGFVTIWILVVIVAGMLAGKGTAWLLASVRRIRRTRLTR